MAAAAVHHYPATVEWAGNTGTGTSAYDAYGRDYTVHVAGKPTLPGSADAAYRGDPARTNPEDMLVTAIAACHMLFYLAACARAGVRVEGYTDAAVGELVLEGGSGEFREVRLRPHVSVAAGADAILARRLHQVAHERCFIARSVRCRVSVEPTITILGEE